MIDMNLLVHGKIKPAVERSGLSVQTEKKI